MPSHSNLAFANDDELSFGDNIPKRENYSSLTSTNGPMPPRSPNERNTSSRSTQRYVTVAILTFINLINYIDRLTIAGILQKVEDYYSIKDTAGGLIQTSFIVSYMIMAPVFGYLGDRYSRKIIIAFGVGFWSVTTLLGSFVPQNLFGVFIFLRALVGTGEASYSTIAPTIIGDLFLKDQRSKMLAIFYFAIPVGSGLGYIVGDQAVKLFGEWQYALRLTPILGLASVILTIFYVKDPPRGEAEGGSNLVPTSIKDDLKDLYKTKSFVYSTLGFTSVAFATGALAWFGPKYMDLAFQRSTPKGEPSSTNTLLIFGVITCIAGIAGVIIGSSASQYFRKMNARADPLICAIGVLLSVPLVFAGVVLADRQPTLSWVLIFFGMVCLCMNWTIVADILLYVIVPTRRSMAEALQILFSHALGDATSPYIIGQISDTIIGTSNPDIDEFLSLQYALYIPTGVLIIGGFFYFLTAVHIEKDKAQCSLATHDIYGGKTDSLYRFASKQGVMTEKEFVKANTDLASVREITTL